MVIDEWFKIRDMGNQTVLFVFDNQPLSFDKHLVAIQRDEKSMHVQDLCFDLVPFWVQVHYIPLRFM